MAVLQKKKVLPSNQSVVEQLRDVGSHVNQTVQTDLVGGVVNNALDSLFAPHKSNEQFQEETFQPKPSETHKPEVVLFNAAEAQLTREVEAARAELSREFSKATHELHELNNEIVEAQKAVALAPAKTGRYHLIFYTTLKRIVNLLKSITRGASESRLWLQTCTSKKQKRGWKGNHKKSSFTQNSERAIAAQAG